MGNISRRELLIRAAQAAGFMGTIAAARGFFSTSDSPRKETLAANLVPNAESEFNESQKAEKLTQQWKAEFDALKKIAETQDSRKITKVRAKLPATIEKWKTEIRKLQDEKIRLDIAQTLWYDSVELMATFSTESTDAVGKPLEEQLVSSILPPTTNVNTNPDPWYVQLGAKPAAIDDFNTNRPCVFLRVDRSNTLCFIPDSSTLNVVHNIDTNNPKPFPTIIPEKIFPAITGVKQEGIVANKAAFVLEGGSSIFYNLSTSAIIESFLASNVGGSE